MEHSTANSPSKKSWRTMIRDWLICRLTCDIEPSPPVPLSDPTQVLYKIRAGDVLLVEGRSRVGRAINTITKSAWSHAALCLGSPKDIKNPELRAKIQHHYPNTDNTPLLIESRLETGVVILPVSDYQNEHIRICRPKGLSEENIDKILDYALQHVGFKYDHQQIFDLARFLVPWFLLPRRWRSSLFAYRAGTTTKMTCSLLIAEAFMSIKYPILPLVRKDATGNYEFIRRNVRLFTPRDFDYSPYFDVIKCPVVDFSETTPYTSIPWNDNLMSHDRAGIAQVIPDHQNGGKKDGKAD